jgi:hypothetical protein
MIKVFTAYTNGLSSAWKEKKMLLWLYGFNLLFAYLITLPLSMILSKALDKTAAADNVLQAFDLTIFLTIMDEFGKGLSLGRTISTFGFLYLIINIFFAGGILKIFIEDKRFNLKEFFHGCVEYFNRFLRLFLLSLLFIIIAIITYLLISKIFGFFTENSITEHLPVILFILKVVMLFIMLAMVNMLFDYARIMTVVNDFHGMYATLKQALMFVMMSPRKTIGLYFSYLFTIILFMTIYLVVESFISVNSWVTILVFFVWTQISFYHYSNTAMPGLTKEMLDMAVDAYEKRAGAQKEGKESEPTDS